MGAFAALSIGRKLVVVGIALAAVAAIIWGLDALVGRIKESGRNEVRTEWAAERTGRAEAKAQVQAAIVAALRPQFDLLAQRISGIDTTAAQVNVRLPAAIAAAPRYRDPNCNLTQPVLDQVNAARALSSEVTP